MGKGVFHNGLQGKGGQAHCCRIYLDLLFHRDAAVEPQLLQIEIIVQPFQLLFQRDLLLLGAQVVPEQAAQPHDHPVGVGSILQPGHAGDHVQGVEQKMRVHLAFQHLQPGVLQIPFQRKVSHLFSVQRLPCGLRSRHGVLHLVEGPGQLTHLIGAPHRQVRNI